MDRDTYDKTESAGNLAELLETHKQRSQVSRILHQFGWALNKCKKMDRETEHIFAELVLYKAQNQLEASVLQEPIRGYVKNVIRSRWRTYIKKRNK